MSSSNDDESHDALAGNNEQERIDVGTTRIQRAVSARSTRDGLLGPGAWGQGMNSTPTMEPNPMKYRSSVLRTRPVIVRRVEVGMGFMTVLRRPSCPGLLGS